MGDHNGIHEFTVGQRKGLPGVRYPRYVTKINVQNKNVLLEKKDLLVSSFIVEELSL